eukprot:NODE_1058_length_2395_cov_0.515679.p1 type:complete len:356 gc:universal NODE_1058_length_2395_cov_0.515679:1363-296(-)
MLKTYLSSYMLFSNLNQNPKPLVALFRSNLMKRENLITCIVNFLFSDDALVKTMNQKIFPTDSTLLMHIIELFGDRGGFMREYQRSLSSKLLTSQNIKKDVEIMKQTLSSLGEVCLKTSDQMLADIKNSEIFSHTFKNISPFQFDVKILTQRFWPNVEFTTKLDLPQQIQNPYLAAQKVFSQSNQHKILVWSITSGSYFLELNIDDTVKEFKVLPIEGLIILEFEKSPTLTFSQLSEKLKIPILMIKKYCKFWQKNDVLHLSGNTLQLVDSNLEKDNTIIMQEHQEIEITPQLKIAMNIMRSIIRTRVKAQLSEIEVSARKSPVFKTFKHSVAQILQLMVQQELVVYHEGFYKIK